MNDKAALVNILNAGFGRVSPEEIADAIIEAGFERGCRCYPLEEYHPGGPNS